MNRGTSTGQFFLSGLWILLALFWFFFNHNALVAAVWLAAAAVTLILGLVKRKKEKAGEQTED